VLGVTVPTPIALKIEKKVNAVTAVLFFYAELRYKGK
jgi:hypothetical protein